jgi:hypothetical protein
MKLPRFLRGGCRDGVEHCACITGLDAEALRLPYTDGAKNEIIVLAHAWVMISPSGRRAANW